MADSYTKAQEHNLLGCAHALTGIFTAAGTIKVAGSFVTDTLSHFAEVGQALATMNLSEASTLVQAHVNQPFDYRPLVAAIGIMAASTSYYLATEQWEAADSEFSLKR